MNFVQPSGVKTYLRGFLSPTSHSLEGKGRKMADSLAKMEADQLKSQSKSLNQFDQEDDLERSMSQTFNPISQSNGNVLIEVIDISDTEEFFTNYATCETHSTPIVIKKEVDEKEKEELKVEKEEGKKEEPKTEFYKKKAMRAVQMKERQEKINEIEKRKKEEEKQLQDLKDEEKREEEARLRKYIPEKIASRALEDLNYVLDLTKRVISG